MNSLIIIGRLTKDPETRFIPGTEKQVASFSVAVDRAYKNKSGERITDFFMCEAFGKTAEFISNYLVKGRLVAIQGEVHIDRYEDKEGVKKSITKVNVSTIKALDKKDDKSIPPAVDPQGFQAIEDDDIPF